MRALIEHELIAKANQVILEAQRLRKERLSLRAEAAMRASELGETVFQVRTEKRWAGALRASAAVACQGEVGARSAAKSARRISRAETHRLDPLSEKPVR